MQLKNRKIAGLLSAATCTLLSHSVHASESPWEIDTAILFYSETDRVSAVEPVINLSKDLGDKEILSLKLVVDSLTGSSANGAVPSTQAQTFTKPSGRGAYTTDANETPLDPTFKDNRTAISLNWEKPIDRNNRVNLGLNLSTEYDFNSFSFNASWDHDINQKNTTLTGGVNLEVDQIEAVGGTPIGLSVAGSGVGFNKDGNSEDRTVTDLLFGVTQVIDKSSLFQINLSLSQADGYLTDPYKILSIVDSGGEPIQNLYENRPNDRLRNSLYGKYKKQLANDDILTTSYRFATDDWGIDSHTLDLTYRLRFDSGYFLQPHLRYYQQSEANFFNYFLVDGEALPEYASADYRLGEMTATTYGLKFGQTVNDQHEWSIRLEWYQQSGDSSPTEAFGQLENQDLSPDVEAVIAQFNYSFQW